MEGEQFHSRMFLQKSNAVNYEWSIANMQSISAEATNYSMECFVSKKRIPAMTFYLFSAFIQF
jgi:hypothetical protein